MEREQLVCEILAEIFPQLYVCYDLDDLYIKDKTEAMKLLQQYLEKDDVLSEKRLLVVTDFMTNREKIVKKIEYVNDDKEEMMMLLFYIVSSFENIVNKHIYFELMYKNFTRKEIKKILYKLSTEEKLGWFLKLLCCKDYTNTKSWSTISDFIQTRNYYIHYGPDIQEIDNKHRMKLSKDSFMSFLECTYDCYSFLNECKSKEVDNFYKRASNLKNFMIGESTK